MAQYKPTTLDDFDYNARARQRMDRLARNANTPSRTQTYQTTEKVGAESARIDQALADAAEAKAGMQGAIDAARDATDAAAAAKAAVDALSTGMGDYLKKADAATTYATKEELAALSTGLPVGSMLVTGGGPPAMDGTWAEVTAFHLPLSKDPAQTFHLYERTA